MLMIVLEQLQILVIILYPGRIYNIGSDQFHDIETLAKYYLGLY